MSTVSSANVAGSYDRFVKEFGKAGVAYAMDRLAARIAAAASAGYDGGTFSTSAHEAKHSHGYYVGGVVASLGILPENSAKAVQYAEVFYPLRDWLAANVDVFTTTTSAGGFAISAYFVGFWYSESEGAWYFDFTQWVLDYSRAMERAERRGEQAIFDCATQADIYVGHINSLTGLHVYGSPAWDAEDEYQLMDEEERAHYFG
jgi:hypothetical protein